MLRGLLLVCAALDTARCASLCARGRLCDAERELRRGNAPARYWRKIWPDRQCARIDTAAQIRLAPELGQMIDFINQHEPVLRALVFTAHWGFWRKGFRAVFRVHGTDAGGGQIFCWRGQYSCALCCQAVWWRWRSALMAAPAGLICRFSRNTHQPVILDFIIYANMWLALRSIFMAAPCHPPAEQTLDVSSGTLSSGEALSV